MVGSAPSCDRDHASSTGGAPAQARIAGQALIAHYGWVTTTAGDLVEFFLAKLDMGIGGLRFRLRGNTVQHYRGFLVAHSSLLFIAEIHPPLRPTAWLTSLLEYAM
jgi:hypothetical protein